MNEIKQNMTYREWPATLAELRELAREERIDVSDIIRRATARYVEEARRGKRRQEQPQDAA